MVQLSPPETVDGLFERLDMALVGFMSDGKLTSFESRITRSPVSWPLADLKSAACIALLYVGTVFVLSRAVQWRARRQGSAECNGHAEPTSLRDKFSRDPVLVLQALYNPVQVVLCAYMVHQAMSAWINNSMSGYCNAFKPQSAAMARVVWVFYLSKVLDFMDTFFMVLRSKWEQLTFLHVYHHTSIFLTYWLVLNAGYDGDIYFTVALNSFVHLVMYGYYALRTFNVAVPLAVKKMVTQLQMIQFGLMVVSAVLTLSSPACEFPKNLMMYYLFYIFSMLYLFNDFSNKAYRKKKAEQQLEKSA